MNQEALYKHYAHALTQVDIMPTGYVHVDYIIDEIIDEIDDPRLDCLALDLEMNMMRQMYYTYGDIINMLEPLFEINSKIN